MLKESNVREGYYQRGLSLVELMVSIVIGLLILAGVVQVVFTSKATFLAQEDMSYIQENARYAMSVLGKDIRGAGYWGCTNSNPRSSNVLDIDAATSPDAAQLVGTAGVMGFNAATTSKFPIETGGTYTRWTMATHDTESFIVRYAGGTPWSIVNDSGANAFMQIQGNANDPAFQAGDFLVATALDCKSIGVFQATDETGGPLGGFQVQTISYASTGGVNCSTKIKLGSSDPSSVCPGGAGGSTFYFPGATLMKYFAHGYFIEESSVLAGQPALKRMVLTNTGGTREEEIAVGVEDMLIMYGVQVGAAVQLKRADEVAATEWPSVVSMQVNMLFRSQSESLPQTTTTNYLGNTYNDRYLRQVVTSTYKLRNRT